MKKLPRIFPLVLFLLILPINSVRADAGDTQSEIDHLKQKVSALQNKISEIQQSNQEIHARTDFIEDEILAQKGLSPDTEFTKSMDSRAAWLGQKIGLFKIRGSLTAIVQSSVNRRPNTSVQGGQLRVDDATGSFLTNNFGQRSSDRTIGAGSFDLYLEANVLENTKFYTNLEANSANQVLSPSISLPNGNTTFSTHLNPQNVDVLNVLELYIENQWYDKKLTTTIGKIDLSNYFDGNKIAWDEHTEFMAASLLDNATFASVLPYNTIGIRANYDISWGLTVQAAAIKCVNSGDKLFSQLFGIVELQYQTFFFFGKEGNYHVYGYVKDVDDRNEMGIPTGTSSDVIGSGISLDQKFTEKLTVFSRLGWNQGALADSVSSLDGISPAVQSSISFGAQYTGLLPNRPEDKTGGAWVLNNPSDPVRPGFPERPDNEYLMEFYYSYTVSPSFHISPILQFLKHPNGDDDENWTAIFGGRACLEF